MLTRLRRQYQVGTGGTAASLAAMDQELPCYKPETQSS